MTYLHTGGTRQQAAKMVDRDKFLLLAMVLVGNELIVLLTLMLKIEGDNASIVFFNIICDDNAQNEEKFPAWKMDLEKSTNLMIRPFLLFLA